MFCPSCGKSIPDDSKFCLHCGTPLTPSKPAKEGIVPSDAPPEFIDQIILRMTGPIEDAKTRRRGRGFTLWFSLRDKSDKPTRADGEVECKLEPKAWWVRAKKYQYKVRKEEFKQKTFTTFGRGDVEYIVHEFSCIEPVLTDNENIDYWVELAFKTTDGRRLFRSTL